MGSEMCIRDRNYNKGIGFQYVGLADNPDFVRLSIEPDAYFEQSERWSNFVKMKYCLETAIEFDENNKMDKSIQGMLRGLPQTKR